MTTFALPDLRDRTAVGTGDAAHAGDLLGSNDVLVLSANFPAPVHDFSSDGNSDILWQSNDGTVAAWLMDGADATSVAAGSFNPGPAWHAKGSGDFDGDGRSDILWQGNDGTAAVWLMDGANTTFVGAVGPFNPGPTWHIEGTGDFNGDGKSDILWATTAPPRCG
jgi:Tol biopolymer transport system component